jgi:hypothetical protein
VSDFLPGIFEGEFLSGILLFEISRTKGFYMIETKGDEKIGTNFVSR